MLGKGGLEDQFGKSFHVTVSNRLLVGNEFMDHGQFFAGQPEEGICPKEYQAEMNEDLIPAVLLADMHQFVFHDPLAVFRIGGDLFVPEQVFEEAKRGSVLAGVQEKDITKVNVVILFDHGCYLE